jgi:hypothetical protein
MEEVFQQFLDVQASLTMLSVVALTPLSIWKL